MGARVGSGHLGCASHAHCGKPATVANGKDLGANVRDLNRSPPIAVQGDGGAVEERVGLGADFEETALHQILAMSRLRLII